MLCLRVCEIVHLKVFESRSRLYSYHGIFGSKSCPHFSSMPIYTPSMRRTAPVLEVQGATDTYLVDATPEKRRCRRCAYQNLDCNEFWSYDKYSSAKTCKALMKHFIRLQNCLRTLDALHIRPATKGSLGTNHRDNIVLQMIDYSWSL